MGWFRVNSETNQEEDGEYEKVSVKFKQKLGE